MLDGRVYDGSLLCLSSLECPHHICSTVPQGGHAIRMGSSRKQSVKAGSATTNSVQRSFAILEFLNASRRGWNISELSRKLDIPKSSTHVLINILSGLGYIQQAQLSNRFQLSPKLYGLGRRALHA